MYLIGLAVFSCISVGLNLRLLYLIGKGVRIRREMDLQEMDLQEDKNLKPISCQGGRKHLADAIDKEYVRCDDENKMLLHNKDE